MVPATSSPRQSAARRSQRRTRLAVLAGAAVLVVGIVAVIQATTDKGSPPVTAAAASTDAPAAPAADPPTRKGGTLGAEARNVVERFVVTTLSRTHLDEAWSLATPSLRNAVSRAQWLAGELPIPPYPIRSLETTGYQVVESSSRKIFLEVLLVPKVGTGLAPIRYDMTVERAAADQAWKVSYFLPYAPPGMQSDKG